MKLILHISNTDIATDSRIRKEIVALSQMEGTLVSSIGLADDCSVGMQVIDGTNSLKLRLLTRAFNFLPRPLLYFLQLIEFTFRVIVHVWKLPDKPAIVHCHDTFALPSGWLAKKICKCSLIYDAHELESNKNGQNAILSFATLAIERCFWGEIDLLVSVSDSIIQWYHVFLGLKPSVLVLNSPEYDPDIAKANGMNHAGYFTKLFGIPKGAPVFVYLGILAPGRGIELCLEAFSVLQNSAYVVFIGSGSLKPIIKKYAIRYPNIYYHSPVSHHYVVPLVSNADYGLCFIENASLSDYLCLPNKLFEYCFAGLQILASDFPEIKKIVTTFELGYCCPPDSCSIANAIASIIRLPSKRGSKDASQLSWSVQAARLKEAYMRIA